MEPAVVAGLFPAGVVGEAASTWFSDGVGLNLTSDLGDIREMVGGSEEAMHRLLRRDRVHLPGHLSVEAAEVRCALANIHMNKSAPPLRMKHRLPPPPDPGYMPSGGWKVGAAAEVFLGPQGWHKCLITQIAGQNQEPQILSFKVALVPDGRPLHRIDQDWLRPRLDGYGHDDDDCAVGHRVPHVTRWDVAPPPMPPPTRTRPTPRPPALQPRPPAPRRSGASVRRRRQRFQEEELKLRNAQLQQSKMKLAAAAERRENNAQMERLLQRCTSLLTMVHLATRQDSFIEHWRRLQAGRKLKELVVPLWRYHRFRKNLATQVVVSQKSRMEVAALTGQLLHKSCQELFQDWPMARLHTLSATATPLHCMQSNGNIVSDGDRSPYAFLVADGVVETRSSGTVVRSCGHGRMVFETSLLNPEPAEHSLVCGSDEVVLWRIHRRDFWREARRCQPAVFDRMTDLMLDRRKRNMLKLCPLRIEPFVAHPVFAKWSRKELSVLIRDAEPGSFRAGTVLAEQGSTPDVLMVIAEGKAAVMRKGTYPGCDKCPVRQRTNAPIEAPVRLMMGLGSEELLSPRSPVDAQLSPTWASSTLPSCSAFDARARSPRATPARQVPDEWFESGNTFCAGVLGHGAIIGECVACDQRMWESVRTLSSKETHGAPLGVDVWMIPRLRVAALADVVAPDARHTTFRAFDVRTLQRAASLVKEPPVQEDELVRLPCISKSEWQAARSLRRAGLGHALRERIRLKYLRPCTVLARAGEPVDAVYLIGAGEVEYMRAGAAQVLGAGEWIGCEEGALLGHASQYTFTVKEKLAALWVLSRQSISEAVDSITHMLDLEEAAPWLLHHLSVQPVSPVSSADTVGGCLPTYEVKRRFSMSATTHCAPPKRIKSKLSFVAEHRLPANHPLMKIARAQASARIYQERLRVLNSTLYTTKNPELKESIQGRIRILFAELTEARAALRQFQREGHSMWMNAETEREGVQHDATSEPMSDLEPAPASPEREAAGELRPGAARHAVWQCSGQAALGRVAEAVREMEADLAEVAAEQREKRTSVSWQQQSMSAATWAPESPSEPNDGSVMRLVLPAAAASSAVSPTSRRDYRLSATHFSVHSAALPCRRSTRSPSESALADSRYAIPEWKKEQTARADNTATELVRHRRACAGRWMWQQFRVAAQQRFEWERKGGKQVFKRGEIIPLGERMKKPVHWEKVWLRRRFERKVRQEAARISSAVHTEKERRAAAAEAASGAMENVREHWNEVESTVGQELMLPGVLGYPLHGERRSSSSSSDPVEMLPPRRTEPRLLTARVPTEPPRPSLAPSTTDTSRVSPVPRTQTPETAGRTTSSSGCT